MLFCLSVMVFIILHSRRCALLSGTELVVYDDDDDDDDFDYNDGDDD